MSSTRADRYNENKPQWSLVDFKSIEPMVRVLEYGAKKYNRENWKKGLPTRETCESLLRHIFAYLNDEDNDPESGISHVGHIQCNAMFLGRFDGTEFDNRKPSPQFRILAVSDRLNAIYIDNDYHGFKEGDQIQIGNITTTIQSTILHYITFDSNKFRVFPQLIGLKVSKRN